MPHKFIAEAFKRQVVSEFERVCLQKQSFEDVTIFLGSSCIP